MYRIADNKNMTVTEQNLVKGALRRVFSRSDLRRVAIENSRTDWTDATRPRVKKWSKCPNCMQLTPTYLMVVDHIDPIIPVTTRLQDMAWNDVVDRIWCSVNNLMAICKPCHKNKTSIENAKRRKKKK